MSVSLSLNFVDGTVTREAEHHVSVESFSGGGMAAAAAGGDVGKAVPKNGAKRMQQDLPPRALATTTQASPLRVRAFLLLAPVGWTALLRQ